MSICTCVGFGNWKYFAGVTAQSHRKCRKIEIIYLQNLHMNGCIFECIALLVVYYRWVYFVCNFGCNFVCNLYVILNVFRLLWTFLQSFHQNSWMYFVVWLALSVFFINADLPQCGRIAVCRFEFILLFCCIMVDSLIADYGFLVSPLFSCFDVIFYW